MTEPKREQLKERNKVPLLKPEHFPKDKRRIVEAIEAVRDHPGHGEPYEGSSEKAGRHPVKPDTTAILAQEAKRKQPTHIVEMGTAYGFSTLYLGYGAPKAHITTFEFDPRVAEEAQGTLDGAGLDAEVVPGTVEEFAEGVLAGQPPIDMVFIDHNKGSYLTDFKTIEPHLAPGALILADNVNDRRAECQDFVDYMTEQYGADIVPTGAGLLVANV
jgi:predicted O-methyltransferase YrrM